MKQSDSKINQVLQYKIESDELKVNVQRVVKEMGYPAGAAPIEMIAMVEDLLEESRHYINLQAGFAWINDGIISADGNHVYVNDTTFHTKRIVGVPLKQMKEAVLFAGTIGHNFDNWSKEAFSSGDPLAGYIIDLLGSEWAERVADWIEAKIVNKVMKAGMTCSNRYSPGYCGWDVFEQHKLFRFLPKEFCGITLSESALMRPQKSVSGIIGISKDIKRMEYPCDVCRIAHCYKNRDIALKVK